MVETKTEKESQYERIIERVQMSTPILLFVLDVSKLANRLATSVVHDSNMCGVFTVHSAAPKWPKSASVKHSFILFNSMLIYCCCCHIWYI